MVDDAPQQPLPPGAVDVTPVNHRLAVPRADGFEAGDGGR